MHRRPLFIRVRDAITGPPAPERHRQRVVIPWYVSLWRFLRPPRVIPSASPAWNRSQRRLLTVTAGLAVLASMSAGVYFFLAGGPARSMAQYDLGMKAAARVNYREAVKYFSDAISIWPDNSRAYLRRGSAHAAMGDSPEAKSDWDRATQLDPALHEAFTARGTQYRIEGDVPKALADLGRSIEIRSSVDAYYQRGQLYATQGNYPLALEDYDRAIAERPDAPDVYRARGAARRAVGDTAGAEQDRALADRIEGRH